MVDLLSLAGVAYEFSCCTFEQIQELDLCRPMGPDCFQENCNVLVRLFLTVTGCEGQGQSVYD